MIARVASWECGLCKATYGNKAAAERCCSLSKEMHQGGYFDGHIY